MLGLKHNEVFLCGHEPEWEALAKRTIEDLSEIFGSTAVDIQHIGSTAIPTIKAKPIIDIAVGVKSFNDINEVLPILDSSAKYQKSHNRFSNDLLYVINDADGRRTHQIHILIYKSPQWWNYVAFRDYMNAFEEEAKEYEKLKVRLVSECLNSQTKYTDGKQEYMKTILRKAKEYADEEKSMKVKWLFFDIGSTLVDESKCIQNRCEIITRENNIEAWEFYKKVLEFAETDAHAVKSAARYYGVEIPKWNTALEFLYPDADMILKMLSNKYKLGIVANQCFGLKDRLNNWGIGKYFDVIVSSAEEGCAKPDLKIFELALERAGCEPREAVMIGDRLDNDIAPAKKIGMKTIWIKQGFAAYQKPKSAEEAADYEITCLTDLSDILK